jgi:hypothetical protein
MENSIGTSIDIHIDKDSNISGSEIGVIHNYGSNFESNYQDAYESIYDDLDDLKNNDLFELLEDINQYVTSDFKSFEVTMKQISCGKAKIPTVNQIRRFLIFCINVIIANNIDISNINLNQIIINNKKKWLFNPHRYDHITIEIAMAKILEYFNKYKNSKIKNGTCFISSILHDGRLDCSLCKDGALNVEEDFEILGDFMNTNKPIMFKDSEIQKNYFEIHTSRVLKFKCGNCVTSIGRVEESKRVLRGEDT